MRSHSSRTNAGTGLRAHPSMAVAVAAVVAALLAIGTALFVFGVTPKLVNNANASAAEPATAAVTDTGTTGTAAVAMLSFPGRPIPPGDDAGGAGDGEAGEPGGPVSSGTTSARTMDDLKKNGWSCTWSAVSGGIWTCSKAGEKDFTCSSPAHCEQLLTGRPEVIHRPGGGVLVQTKP